MTRENRPNALPDLLPAELSRYSRHLALPEVGLEGQRRLKAARVLVVGVGGLGSPVSLYLAAAGVGTIGLVDFDVVDVTNLQRQVLFDGGQTGQSKISCARERLTALNPQIHIVCHELALKSENALGILSDYDLVVDGTDNFATRYLVNDACVLLDKPNVYGSIYRFEGQASVFHLKGGPCYRCLYPEPPPPGLVPSCAEGGVLGVLPGIIGSIQATEALKIILGKEDTLSGRFLLFDALSMKFTEMKVVRDVDCPVCGENPSVTSLIDYDEFCGGATEDYPDNLVEISAFDLEKRLERVPHPVLLDVREPHELEISRFENAISIPVREIPEKLDRLRQEDEIVVVCRTGVRSARVCGVLLKAGFNRVSNLQGGINAWARDVDHEMPVY